MTYKISGCAEDCREPRARAALTGRIHQFQNGMPPTSPREDNAAVARQGAPIVGSRSSLIVLFLTASACLYLTRRRRYFAIHFLPIIASPQSCLPSGLAYTRELELWNSLSGTSLARSYKL